VIYSEAEKFTNNFTYPYYRKKSVLNAPPGTRINMYLRQSVTCFDDDLWSDFQFWKDDACDISDTSNFLYKKWQTENIAYDEAFTGTVFAITIGISSLK
jgi:hypothetical protein